ncbi:DotA/TraY family protein (plasmid) [Pseudomonas silesiensis]|uniref:DotA/TraY family protein n=1 Tax=Pseudomonas silesiensis TaxID=1853130 RepID=UPI0030CD268D
MIKKLGGLLGAVVLLFTLFTASPAMAEAIDGAAAEGYMTHIMSMPYDSTDLAHKTMVRLFGGFIFEPFGGAPGTAPTILAKVLGYTNIVAMILGVIIMGYVILAGALNTAASGEMLGRSWSSVWLPLRTSLAFGMIMPATTGEGTFSVAQSLVMWMIIVGSNSATWLWNKAADELATGTPVMPTTVHYDAQAYRPIPDIIHCSAVRDKILNDIEKSHPDAGEVMNKGASTNRTFKYAEIGSLDLTKATKIKFEGCGTFNFPMAEEALVDTALENSVEDHWDMNTTWEKELQKAYNQAVSRDIKPVIAASIQAANFIVSKNMNTKQIQAALEQGGAEALEAKTNIEEAAVKYAAVSTAYDTYIENVRKSTTAGGADEGWKASMTQGGWMRAGAWFFEASRLQGFVQTLLSKLGNIGQVEKTQSLDGSCSFISLFSKCKEQAEEFRSWLDVMEKVRADAAVKSKGKNNITKSGGVAKTELTTDTHGQSMFDENFTSTISVLISQNFMDKVMEWGADDARGLAGGDGAVTSSSATGMISPFTAVSSIGRGLQQIAVMAWVAGAAVAGGIGWMESPPGILAQGASVGWLGAVKGVGQYALASLAPIIAGVGALAFMLAFAIPFMPVTVWIMLVCGYLLTVIEAIAAAPLAVIMLATPEGEGMSSGNFTKALQMVNSVILRPTLSIVGLFAAMTLSYVGFSILNDLFWSVAKMTTDVSIFEVMALIFIYASTCFKVCEYMVTVIHKIPDQIMDWMGGGLSRPFGEDAAASDVSGSLKQNAGASGLTAMAGMKTAGGIVEAKRNKANHQNMLNAMGGKKDPKPDTPAAT